MSSLSVVKIRVVVDKEWQMEGLVNRAIRRYLKKHYPRSMKKIIARAERIRPKLMKNAPDMGGKENTLAGNLNMFIL